MTTISELQALSPIGFEKFIATFLPKLGYKDIKLTSFTADSGYDISTLKDGQKVLIECKRYSSHNKVGARDVRIFADACQRMNANQGIFITTSSFTNTVYQEQRSRNFQIEFWDGSTLLIHIKNSEFTPAYCVDCSKPLSGYYEFKLGRNKKIVPTHPKKCIDCENKTECVKCRSIIDKRTSVIRSNNWYCRRCNLKVKKKNKRDAIILSIMCIFVIVTWIFMLTQNFLFIPLLIIALLIILILNAIRIN